MHLFQTVLALTACGAPPADAGPPLPSARANAVYTRALAALEDMYVPINPKSVKQAYAEFAGELDRLLDAFGEDKIEQEKRAERIARTEGQSLAGKLVAIALDRRRRPELYEAVENEYGSVATGVKPKGTGARFDPGRQFIKKKFIDEQYRLVWECRLLAAPAAAERPFIGGGVSKVGDVSGIHMPPTLEALVRIGNETSAISLVFFFRHACRDGDGPFGDMPNIEDALEVIESLPTVNGLRAVLACAEWCEWNKGGAFAPNGFRRESPPAAWVKDLGSSTRPDRDKWRKALAELPEDSLSERQREIVRTAKKVAATR
ncbi:MAG: hypothetical protein U0746_10675 [Gemmataceae bacterium]